MKNIKLLLITFVLICSSAIAQTTRQKRADNFFDRFLFVKVIDRYQKMIEKDDNKDYALRKLGDTYIMLRKPKKALAIYKQVVQQPSVPPKYYYYYAQVLRATGNYKESKVWMKKFRDEGNKTDSRVKQFFKEGDLASGIFNSDETYKLSKLYINTKFNEFGAVELGDKLYFASSRDEGVSVKRIYAWDHQPMLDVFVTFKEGGSVNSTKKLKGDVNTIQHDGPVTFNADGTKMYFSRNNYHNNKKIKDSKGTMQVGIYTADLVDGIWTNVNPINLNNSNYLVYNPSLSKDGTKLYFASDMPGGYGGTDIYVSEVNGDGSLGIPKNLGGIVNSEGNETFPFIHKNETLYFSSDGHVGMGFLDVFATVKEGEEIVNIINLGTPINSKKDDFSYFLSDDELTGYISSNREKGVGNDDIYRFSRPIPPLPLLLRGRVLDTINDEAVAGAKVVLKRRNGGRIAELITEEDGSYEYLIDRDDNYVIVAGKDDYAGTTKDFTSYDLEKDQEEIIVDLIIEKTEKPETGDFVVVGNKILIRINPIYFDLDKSFVRKDAMIELNKVIKIMEKYPDMIVEGGSHTDSQGGSKYNMNLSTRRAKATVDYIISIGGISPSRISARGYGETQLTNRCSNGVRCSKSEHQKNRRTEFVIVKMK